MDISLYGKEQLYADLKNNFYVQVPFTIDSDTIERTMKAFFTFLQLPEDIKMSIKTKIAPNHRRGELGLQRRGHDGGIQKDQKEFFHYHPILLQAFPEQIARYTALKCFMDEANHIWQHAAATVKSLMGHLDNYFPGVHDAIFDENHTPHFVLRFLGYEFTSNQFQLAEAHFDAGSCTLAIAESCRGLRIGSCDENLKLVEHHPNQALFMLARNFKKLANSNDLLPGWHDVIKVEDSKPCTSAQFQRWALVMFIEGHSIEAPSREETHSTAL